MIPEQRERAEFYAQQMANPNQREALGLEMAFLRAQDDQRRAAMPLAAPLCGIPESEWTHVDCWAEIHRLRAALKGPEGFATWQDAATAERIRRVAAERQAPAPKALEWSEPRPANGKDFFYDHVVAESPLGQFTIEWKGWKHHDSKALHLAGDYLDNFHDVDDAKAAAAAHIAKVLAALIG